MIFLYLPPKCPDIPPVQEARNCWVLGPQTFEFSAGLEHAWYVPGRPFTCEASTDPVPHDFLQVVCESQDFVSFAACLNVDRNGNVCAKRLSTLSLLEGLRAPQLGAW